MFDSNRGSTILTQNVEILSSHVLFILVGLGINIYSSYLNKKRHVRVQEHSPIGFRAQRGFSVL